MKAVDLSALAYAVRKACTARGVFTPLGHAQQLVAAALGYGSLAAYQAASIEQPLMEARHLVIDIERLLRRAKVLDAPASCHVVEAVIETLVQQLPFAVVHQSEDDLLRAVQTFVNAAVVADAYVASAMSTTQGGVSEVYMPVFAPADGNEAVDCVQIDISGSVSMERDLDSERIYWGHHIDVQATLELSRTGKRTFGQPALAVSSAKLRWFDQLEEEPEALPAVAAAPAAAEPATSIARDALGGVAESAEPALSPESLSKTVVFDRRGN